jgi:hypothetical protein
VQDAGVTMKKFERGFVWLAMSALASVLLLAAAISQSIAAHAQQPPMTITMVTLLTVDSGFVDAAAIATKDIVDRVTSLRRTPTAAHLVQIKTCPKVPADTIQAMVKELQTRRFLVAIDLNAVDPQICSR